MAIVTYLDLCDIMAAQEQAWIDATADDGLEEVRDIPAKSHKDLEQTMICDIQRVDQTGGKSSTVDW